MSTEITRSETPEERELARKQAEFAALEADLAQRELELATARGELHAFQARYIRIVGARFAELDEIRAQIAQVRARGSPNDRGAQEEAAEARIQAEESARAAGSAQEGDRPVKFRPSESLKKLFREVAKRIHPDLANDEPDRVRRTRLMAEANRAFEEGDEAKLRAILEEWESSPESVKGEGAGAELVRIIRRIAQAERRLGAIQAEREELERSDMYQLMLKSDEAEADSRDLLTDMAADLDEQISDAKNELAAVAGE